MDIYPDGIARAIKAIAHKLLKELGCRISCRLGVMFLAPSEFGVRMRPVVLVRDIDTLFYETACGSGTTAIGLLEAS